MPKQKISIVIPIYNEGEGLSEFFRRLTNVVKTQSYDYEIVAVNDGSVDNTFAVLQKHAEGDPNFKVIDFQQNEGQTAALLAGIDHATGDIIVPIDSDLENHPEDIPLLLAKLDEGHDVVSGWRADRWKNNSISRKFPSRVANSLISYMTGVKLNDYGCTLKAYRSDVIKGIPLYGEMHRFIPAYASWRGARVIEIQVQHEARKYGKTNYGLSRTFRVLLDLLLIKFLEKYKNRPMHFFGGFGFLFLFLGALTGVVAVGLRLFYDLHLVQTPLPTLSALFLIMGLNFVLIGVVAEMVVRGNLESGVSKSYSIKRTINL
jgi:glycosyltransferase involved in cell wall biosynthesis